LKIRETTIYSKISKEKFVLQDIHISPDGKFYMLLIVARNNITIFKILKNGKLWKEKPAL
jgi:6-phosphogluconolactonase (cycloisomerase 2 family)